MLSTNIRATEEAWAFFGSVPFFSKAGTATVPPPEPNRPFRKPQIEP